MKERRAIKGVEGLVIDHSWITRRAEMVDNYIYHKKHLSRMDRIGKCLEILGGPKVGIKRVDILLPVAMIGFAVARVLRHLRRYRGNPYSRKSHVLNVIEFVNYAFPCTSTVSLGCWIARCCGGLVGTPKAVS